MFQKKPYTFRVFSFQYRTSKLLHMIQKFNLQIILVLQLYIERALHFKFNQFKVIKNGRVLEYIQNTFYSNLRDLVWMNRIQHQVIL
ncbi:unnamed protein product [Paramecium sonneborni]|uniref:Uncharacterized protein n=1 Tax=Paramecium sonneborni TaxID=65129 RepID=A0A8S1R2E9_9CILI|nr:unnamed protein product [Paramecium sonneborni]